MHTCVILFMIRVTGHADLCHTVQHHEIRGKNTNKRQHTTKKHGAVDIQFHSFLTSALDYMSCQIHAHAAFPGERAHRMPNEYETRWAPWWIWAFWRTQFFPIAWNPTTIPPPLPTHILTTKSTTLIRFPISETKT